MPRHRDPLVIGWRRWACGPPWTRTATAGTAGMSTREDWSSGMVSTTVRASIVWTPLLRLLSTALLLSVFRLAMGGLVLRASKGPRQTLGQYRKSLQTHFFWQLSVTKMILC